MAKPPVLNTKQVMTTFGVSQMTVHNWRRGSARRAPLPSFMPNWPANSRPGFRVSDVKRWARQNGIEVLNDPLQVLAESAAAPPVRPGPKPRPKSE
jgi:hypothetical protein